MTTTRSIADAAQKAAYEEALDLLVRKLPDDEGTIGVEFPFVTDEAGKWRTMPASRSAGYQDNDWDHGNWFCGFWVGLLLIAYVHTGDQRYRDWATERMRLVAPRAKDPNTHDIGFIFESSAIPAYRLLGDIEYAELALEAAGKLRARVIATPLGAYLSSWGPLDDERGRSSSAIDTMANLPLLFWAANHTKDASYRVVAESHAKMTLDAFVRSDQSTCHAVTYDPVTGAVSRQYTFQGYSDRSCWSRGQAWAIYGFAATATATRNIEYLSAAECLAQYFLGRLDDSMVPYWDFDDPTLPNAPRDSSAAAVLASGLLDIASLHPDAKRGEIWHRRAQLILASLCRDYMARSDAHRGLLMHGCYSRPHHIGEDSAVLFGDYFFAEALCKVCYPGTAFAALAPLSNEGS